MKYIYFRLLDTEYRLPVNVIADQRAAYYANKDFPNTIQSMDWLEDYNKEFQYTIKDNSEILDWLHNNIIFEDIEKYLEKTKEFQEASLKSQWMDAMAEGRVEIHEG